MLACRVFSCVNVFSSLVVFRFVFSCLVFSCLVLPFLAVSHVLVGVGMGLL